MKTLSRLLSSIDELRQNRLEWLRTMNMFHEPTPRKRGGLRHRGYTKTPNNGESKARRKMAAKSRRINR